MAKHLEKNKSEIFEYINNSVKIIDTHEHFQNYDKFILKNGLIGLILTNSIIGNDLYSSGLDILKFVKSQGLYPKFTFNSSKYNKMAKEPDKLIKVFIKSFKNILNTSYYRFFLKALIDIYDFNYDGISEYNWEVLSNKISKNYKTFKDWSSFAKEVIQNKCNIELIIRDNIDTEQFSFIRTSYNFDYLLYYLHEKRLEEFINQSSFEIFKQMFRDLDYKYSGGPKTFNEYLEIINNEISEIIEKRNIVAVKVCAAYNRSLYFEYIDRREAKKIFEKNIDIVTKEESKKLQDYIMHKIIQRITDENIVMQIHTGIQGYLSFLEWGNPVNLNNLFLLYPKTKFDLFHAGYPYSDELLALTKLGKNVFCNFCWLTHLSESVAEDVLSRALDLIPNNKLLWGGDTFSIEELYGAVYFAKDIVSEVLAEKVSKNNISLSEAKFIAENIFRNNARRIYNL